MQISINQLRKDIESLKKSNERFDIYIVSVDDKGNESEPEHLLSFNSKELN